MAITSFPFAVFTILNAIVYFVFPKKDFRWVILLLASSFFYVYNSFKYSIFILVTIVSVYLAAQRMAAIASSTRAFLKAKKESWPREQRKAFKEVSDKKRKLVLTCTLLLNFGILFLLKYFNFFSGSIAELLGSSADSAPHINILLPLGISFYTFISTGYLIDVYREKIEPESNFLSLHSSYRSSHILFRDRLAHTISSMLSL